MENKPKSIGIDCRMSDESGIGRYITNLVKNYSTFDSKNRYTLYVYRKDAFKSFSLPANFEICEAPFRWHTIKEQISFLNLINKGNHDIFHFPQTNYPLLYRKKFIITIHDLTMVKLATGRASTLFYPFYLIKLFFFKTILLSAIKNSEKIITVSEFVKKELQNNYQVSPEKIQVIYNGIDSKLIYEKKDQSYFKENYGIEKPFLFYVGNAYPHKNLERLILSFTAFNSHNEFNLVLGGKSDYFYERLKEEYKDLKNIHFVGALTDEELSKFYSSCLFFVYPSLSEGFGIQIVESLGLGTKVCCSNNSVFPEIALNHAVYFNPYDTQDMISAFQRTLSSGPKISDSEISFLKQKFNWENSAKLHLKIYENF